MLNQCECCVRLVQQYSSSSSKSMADYSNLTYPQNSTHILYSGLNDSYSTLEKLPSGYLAIYGTKSLQRSQIQLQESITEIGTNEKNRNSNLQNRKYRKSRIFYGEFDQKSTGTISRYQIRKHEERREKNRLAAKNCREEKQNYIHTLETRVASLEMRNRELIEKLAIMKDIVMKVTKEKLSNSEMDLQTISAHINNANGVIQKPEKEECEMKDDDYETDKEECD